MQQSSLMMRWIEEADGREFVLARKMVTPAAKRDDAAPADGERVGGEKVGGEVIGLLRRCCEIAHWR